MSDFQTSSLSSTRSFRSWVEVDLSALGHNIRSLKRLAGPQRLLMACVKSEAYGHGLIKVATAAVAAGANRLAVAHMEEGVALRRAGLVVPIQVLMEPPLEATRDMARHDLIASLSSLKKAEAMAVRLDRPLTVHVEVDTGMGRVPLQANQSPEFIDSLKRMGPFRVEGLFSHFSSAGDPNEPGHHRFTCSQLATFKRLCSRLEEKGLRIALKHMAGSDAVAFYPESYLDMIRPGAWVYGYKGESVGIDLKPVLSWKTKVFRVTRVPAGQAVGYDMSYRSGHDTRIAHLPVGYGDGYPRALSNIGSVLIKGQRVPIAGLVGMESMMVDLGDIPGEIEGQEVTLIGRQGSEQITAAELANSIGMFGVMITCGIKEKVKRIYIPEK